MAGNQPEHGSDLSPTLNVSGQTGPSPRAYGFGKRRHLARNGIGANQYTAYLAAQATRLSSSSAVVDAKVKKYGARRVTLAANLAALP